MGLGGWLKRWFGIGGQAIASVPYFDVESGRLIRIPAAELRPGAVQARVQGIEGPVWLLPDQLTPGEIRHPPFEEGVREFIRGIHEAFAEQRTLSLDEWEDGFRRDADPAREIAMWPHAADLYTTLASGEVSAERRRDIYRWVVACLTTTPDRAWHVVKLPASSRAEMQQVADRSFGEGR